MSKGPSYVPSNAFKRRFRNASRTGRLKLLQNHQCAPRVESGDRQWRLATYTFRNPRFRSLLFPEKRSSSYATHGRLTACHKVALGDDKCIENPFHNPVEKKYRRFHCDRPRVAIHLVQRHEPRGCALRCMCSAVHEAFSRGHGLPRLTTRRRSCTVHR